MTHPNPPAQMPTTREARSLLLVAPAAFIVIALYNYALAPALCGLGWGDQFLFRLFSFVLTTGGVLVGFWGFYGSYRNRTESGEAAAADSSPPRFLSVGGILLSVLFISLTLFAGLSSLAFQPCRPV